MNTIREIEKINQEELDRGLAGTPASWHAKYSKSAWVYLGNLDHELTEGDIICVVSQFGEVEDIHLAREEDTGKSRGFAFVKYEDARSCVLAVDNFIGSKLLGRSIRIDHVEKYRLPKKVQETEDEKGELDVGAGHAYKDAELSNKFSIHQGQDVFAPVQDGELSDESSASSSKERKRRRKDKHRKRKKESRRKHSDRKLDPHTDSEESDARRKRRKRSKYERKRKHRRRGSDNTSVSDERKN